MLLNLHIKNMALIDEIDIDFSENFNVLTGETGAGKSIVIDSILIALGGKTPKDFVRKEAEYGMVELLFSVDNQEVMDKLKEFDVVAASDGEIVISRKIIGNRSISKINGETLPLSRIRDIAGLLLDLHAQHEHQSLLIPANHLKLLDRYGHTILDPLKENVKTIYHDYLKIKNEFLENTMNENEKKRKMDLIVFERNEIFEAALKEGEDLELENAYKLASNYKKIAESLSVASNQIAESGSDTIDRALREMYSVSEYDKELESMTEILTTVSDLMVDFNRSAREYLDNTKYSDEEFYQMEERLNKINHLKSKYGKSISDILEYGETLENEYEKLVNHDEYILRLKNEWMDLENKLREASEKLSIERKKIAKRLSKEIKSALIDLNFLDVQFDIIFEEIDHLTENGMDYPYFIISTNPGEQLKPLWKVASGGELSRIMLAMKSCLADSDNIETLIFDEIDVGISGRTAQMVAEKIYQIGKNHQVICITHLPQIAAMANHHYLIEKNIEDQKTITKVYPLDSQQEIMEIARLIGGVKITDTVIQSAKEMKELASKAKVN